MTIAVIEEYHCYQLHTKFYPTLLSQGEPDTKMELLGIIIVNFDVTSTTDQIFCIRQILEKKGV